MIRTRYARSESEAAAMVAEYLRDRDTVSAEWRPCGTLDDGSPLYVVESHWRFGSDGRFDEPKPEANAMSSCGSCGQTLLTTPDDPMPTLYCDVCLAGFRDSAKRLDDIRAILAEPIDCRQSELPKLDRQTIERIGKVAE